jgi:CheY-like chemotaxis protein
VRFCCIGDADDDSASRSAVKGAESVAGAVTLDDVLVRRPMLRLERRHTAPAGSVLDMDGLDVITGLRGWSNFPIVVVSGRDAEGDKIAQLGAGADDSLTKPFGMGELVARLRAVLRRCRPARAEQPRCDGPFRYRPAGKRAINSDGEVRLKCGDPEYESEAHYLRVYMTRSVGSSNRILWVPNIRPAG